MYTTSSHRQQFSPDKCQQLCGLGRRCSPEHKRTSPYAHDPCRQAAILELSKNFPFFDPSRHSQANGRVGCGGGPKYIRLGDQILYLKEVDESLDIVPAHFRQLQKENNWLKKQLEQSQKQKHLLIAKIRSQNQSLKLKITMLQSQLRAKQEEVTKLKQIGKQKALRQEQESSKPNKHPYFHIQTLPRNNCLYTPAQIQNDCTGSNIEGVVRVPEPPQGGRRVPEPYPQQAQMVPEPPHQNAGNNNCRYCRMLLEQLQDKTTQLKMLRKQMMNDVDRERRRRLSRVGSESYLSLSNSRY